MTVKMRMCFKNVAVLMVVAAWALLLLNSCAAGSKDADENQAGSENRSESQEIAETEKIYPDLPDANYNGHKFNILVTSEPGDAVRNDFLAEGITGEVINDAKFARNTYVEEKYGIVIGNFPSGWVLGRGVDLIKKSSAAGDFAYDAAMVTVYDACDLAIEGLVMDLKEASPIDLSKPWWDQRADRDLAIRGKMYFTTGDISQVVNDSSYAVLFNKKLARDYDVEDPYEIVISGKWTFDKLAELGDSVSSDINGDGLFDENDLYGAIIEDDTMMSVINSIGERCAEINENGEIELSLFNDRTVSVIKKYTDWAFDKTAVYAYQRYVGKVGDYYFITMYENNQALFLMRGMETITELRAMETDFGILPFPKLDENQTDYYSPVGAWKSMFLCIPAVQEDAVRTAVILEALAAESRYTLRPAYYDVSLKGKNARDEESLEMLHIILSTRIYDFGWYYQFGNYNNSIMDLFRNYNSDFSSMYAKNQSRAESDVRDLNDRFGQLVG